MTLTLRSPGTSGNYVSTPDSAAVSITGDLDLRAYISMDDWTPGDAAGQEGILGKWVITGNQRSYLMSITNVGKIILNYSVDGTASSGSASSVATGFADGTDGWIRTTLVVNDGSGNHVTTYYTSVDGQTWVQLGTPVTVAGTITLFDSTAGVEVGSWENGSAGGADGRLVGKVYYTEVRNGINGTVAASFNPTAVTKTATRVPTTYTSPTTEVWTTHGSAWDWVFLTSLAIDGSSPVAVTSTGTAVTTASFTPPANSLLVAIVALGNASGSATPSGSLTDSLTNGWTKTLSNYLGGDAGNEIWTWREGSSPAARTVTITGSPGTTLGVQLAVLVFTGAATHQVGAATAVVGAAGVTSRSLAITTTTVGSYVVGSYGYNVSPGVTLAVLNGSTTNLLATNDLTNNENYGCFRTTVTTGTPGSITLGYTGSNVAANTFIALLEILPALPTSSDNILNPAGDVSINTWTTDSGGTSNLFLAIDEFIASDTDYIQSPVGPDSSLYYETELETSPDPSLTPGHVVHYRYQKNVASGNIDLTAALVQGTAAGEKLTVNQAGIETDTTGWAAEANTTIARTTAQHNLGVASLSLTATGAGNMSATTPTGTSGFPVVPGELFTAFGYALAATSARTLQTNAKFYDASGTLVSTLTASGGDDITGWAQAPALVSQHVPTTAIYAALQVVVVSAGAGEVHYFDDLSFASDVGKLIARWQHTSIGSTWTQQDQTLTAPQADSITDYSDLRLRFIPSTTTSDQVPTYVADRATANSNSTVTTVDLVLSSLTVGNYLIVRSAADNSGGSGAARTFTPSNLSGTAMGTHTEYQQNEDPGAASAGTTLNVSVIKIAATSGTIRLTYSGAVVQACVAEEWSGIDPTTPVVGTPVKSTSTASSNLASSTDASIALGNVAYGVDAIEGPPTDTYTQDADTTNGSWVGLTKVGTTNVTADTNQTIYAAYKAVTSAGAQTYNPTINTTPDSAGMILELAAATATIKTQVSWANLEIPFSPYVKEIRQSLQAVKRASTF